MDFVDTYIEYTEGRPSPKILREWAAIGTLSGALEKRVWVELGMLRQYANLYVMFVVAPGVGKSQAINPLEEILKSTKRFHIAPNSVTAASFIDSLAKAQRQVLFADKQRPPQVYHHLFVFAAELGVFMSAYDLNFTSLINELYDHKESYREERRHSLKDPIEIPHPMATLILGTQPSFLGTILPDSAWNGGFMSRMIMIYASETPKVPLFGKVTARDDLKKALAGKLNEVADYHGHLQWDAEAVADFEKWYEDDFAPVPVHPKLEHYTKRRGKIHAVKLAMVAAMSRGAELVIRKRDVERARCWLLEAEELMPQIFRDMTMRSDEQVIEETFQYCFELYLKQRQPLPAAVIFRFLSQRAPADKAERILTLMEKSEILERVIGTQTYIPRAGRLGGAF